MGFATHVKCARLVSLVKVVVLIALLAILVPQQKLLSDWEMMDVLLAEKDLAQVAQTGANSARSDFTATAMKTLARLAQKIFLVTSGRANARCAATEASLIPRRESALLAKLASLKEPQITHVSLARTTGSTMEAQRRRAYHVPMGIRYRLLQRLDAPPALLGGSRRPTR